MQQGEDEKKAQKREIHLCKRRLQEIRKLAEMKTRYVGMWKNDGSLKRESVTKQNLVSFLKMFNVDGRSKIAKGSKELIIAALENIEITQSSVEKMEDGLLEKLRDWGEEDDYQLGQSFGTESSFISYTASSDGEEAQIVISVLLESETSAGGIGVDIEDTTDKNIDTDVVIDSDSDNTNELIQSLEAMSRKRVVLFNDLPTIFPIPPTISNDSSSPVAPQRSLSRRQPQANATVLPALQLRRKPQRT